MIRRDRIGNCEPAKLGREGFCFGTACFSLAYFSPFKNGLEQERMLHRIVQGYSMLLPPRPPPKTENTKTVGGRFKHRGTLRATSRKVMIRTYIPFSFFNVDTFTIGLYTVQEKCSKKGVKYRTKMVPLK